MKLKNAAKYFDWDTVYDGYTGIPLFKAQFSSFEGQSPDGSFNRRRTVSVASDAMPAARRVVKVQGVRWIMGELVIDTFKDKQIRCNASAKEVTELFTILTPGQAALKSLSGLADAYAHSDYLKSTVNSISTSQQQPAYDVYFASVESLKPGYFLRSPIRLCSVRSVYWANEGYWVAQADELMRYAASEEAEVSVTLAGAFDPVTETYGLGTTTTGVMVPMVYLYQYNTEIDPRNQAGDMSLIVAKSAVTPTAGQIITINSESWRNVKFTELYDAWNIQVRRA